MINIRTKLAHSSNYAVGRGRKKISYIVVHYTANDGDTAAGNCNYFSGANRKASAHYFVDKTSVWQSVKDTDTAWHCGGSLQGSGGHSFHGICSNSNSIGVEMCSKIVNGKYTIPEETQANTLQLVKMLMDKYQVPADRVIRHYDVTGKICPKPFVEDPGQWQVFKQKLTNTESEEEEMKRYNSIAELPKALQKEAQELVDAGALAGSDGKLDVTEDMIRTMIVNKRYTDKAKGGK